MKKRIMRPRLEHTVGSNVSARVTDDEYPIEIEGEFLKLRDAKRLYAFLGKAIAYIAQRKGRGK